MLDTKLIDALDEYNKNAEPGEIYYISECEECGQSIFRELVIPEKDYHSIACLCGKAIE
ncbi:hypothetical protein [Bacillus sp. OAE603]|uniref:hypothetical protein n=1 Tax=Gottfriedia sp. OAE603 TaxID=2663872 RepID=UPI00178B7ED7